MAKKKMAPKGDENEAKRKELLVTILTENPKHKAKNVYADQRWIDAGYGKIFGQQMSSARKAAGITKAKGTAKKKAGRSGRKPRTPATTATAATATNGVTADAIRSALAIVREHFNGKIDDAINQLEAIERIGGTDTLRALKEWQTLKA